MLHCYGQKPQALPYCIERANDARCQYQLRCLLAGLAVIDEYREHVDVAADPILKYMSKEQMQKAIERTRKQMVEAAKKMDFIEAAQYRDELIKLEDLYQKTTTTT